MSFCCSCASTIAYLAVVPVLILLIKHFYTKWNASQLEKMLARWSGDKTKKDVIILHSMRRGKSVPTVSPFALKIETYFRMCGIPYETDFTDMRGPKGKFPWISINGEHVADSELIIEFISKKFEKNFSKNLDQKSKSISMMIRIVLEEYFFWGMVTERFMFGRRHLFDLSKVLSFEIPKVFLFIGRFVAKFEMTRKAQAQGVGLHTEEEIIQLMTKTLRAISVILGNQKFICGDNPTEEDAGIFGIVAQVVFALSDSPYERLVKGELKNLEEYAHRMKNKFWPDWEKHIGN